ncbi:MAG: hypothetical protein K8H74_13515, partial [Notoacmeibacter sp.]|nr:hypothetical protein [Notoacmeibacter sp.]
SSRVPSPDVIAGDSGQTAPGGTDPGVRRRLPTSRFSEQISNKIALSLFFNMFALLNKRNKKGTK